MKLKYNLAVLEMKNNQTLDEVEKMNNLYKENNKEFILKPYFIYLIFGFLLSISNICGITSPLGVTLCSTVNQEFLLSVSIGSLLGYIFSNQNNMVYIISVFLILVFRFVFGYIKNIKPSIITLLSFLSSSFIFMLIDKNLSFYNILTNISISVMASGTAFFFCNTEKILRSQTFYKGLAINELSTVLISFSIIIITLLSINFYEVSIGKIIAIYSILIVALSLDAKSSAILGMIISFSILINGQEQNSYIILSYSVGGFLAGLAKKYKNIGVASVFIVINSLTYILTSIVTNERIYSHLFELGVASSLFIVTSNLLKNNLALIKDNEASVLNCENAKSLMLLKLSFASNTLHDISKETQRLSERLSKNLSSNINDIYYKCIDNVCNQCKSKMFCWNKSFNDIMNSFNDISLSLKQKGRVTQDNVSEFMKQKCNNINEIISVVNESYNRFITKKSMNRKIEEIREVVTDQFDSMAIMLKELAREFCDISTFDKQSSIKAKKVLSNIGLHIYSISSFNDKYGRLTIEAITNTVKNTELIGNNIILKLSDVCDRNFGVPSFITLNNITKITIIEKATYEIDFGATQFSRGDFKFCGDAYNYFIDSKGKAYMVLSDGMGTGKQASIDGNITANLLSKLIKAGFDFEAASKIVNSTLLVKPGDESLSTIDVTSVDLYTGQTQTFKAGAAPTFIRKSDKILEIECLALPAGILKGISFDRKSILLKNKDIIIMVSDGVTNSCYDWIYNEIKSFKYNMSAQELSRKIALESKFINKLSHDDDVTVMVGIISKGD